MTAYCPSDNSKVSNKPIPIISTSPILFFDVNNTIHKPLEMAFNGTEMRITTLAKELFSECICIDDITGSSYLWYQKIVPASAIWQPTFLFTHRNNQSLFQLLHRNNKSTIQPNTPLLNTIPFAHISVIDISFVSTKDNTTFEWRDLVRYIYIKALTLVTRFKLLIDLIPEVSFFSSIKTICLSILLDSIPTNWILHYSLVEAQHYETNWKQIDLLSQL